MFSRNTLRPSAFIRTPLVREAPAYIMAVLLLCLPALWNGFPLMFDDVGGYLERWPSGSLGLGRSAVYGLLLWLTRSMAFVPAIVLQALVTTFVVDRALKAFVPGACPPWLLAAAVAVIAATSGAALFVSKPIPDAWAAPAVLALHLLVWHPRRLSKGERIIMGAIIAFAGASHMATFAVLAGMSVVHAAAKPGIPGFAKFMSGRERQQPISAGWRARGWLCVAPRRIGFAAVAVWSGLALQAAGNLIVTGRISLASDGDIFLFASMVEDGGAGDILAEECPRAGWKLCKFRDALPSYAEAFLFNADSPLQKIGGAFDPGARHEIAAIVTRSLIRHPLAHARRALELTTTQFVDAGTGGAMEQLMSGHTRAMLMRYAPALVPWFDAARQQTDEIDVSGWSDWIVVPVSVAASFALPFSALLLWRRRRRQAMLPALLFLALLGNAAICGVVAGPNDRYQARLVWLAPLALGLLGRVLVRPISALKAGAEKPASVQSGRRDQRARALHPS